MSRVLSMIMMTDGRKEYISKAIPSALTMLKGSISRYLLFDDSADPEYQDWIRENFPLFELICNEERRGLAGATQAVWDYLKNVETDYVIHLEDDFTFNEVIPLDEMIEVLETHPYLYEMSLLRQPWWQWEVAAGGIIQANPDAYTQKEKWVEHRQYFTTNPCIYRKSLIYLGWPNHEGSESTFYRSIIENDPNAQFGIWGRKEDKPRVFHIGDLRIGTQY